MVQDSLRIPLCIARVQIYFPCEAARKKGFWCYYDLPCPFVKLVMESDALAVVNVLNKEEDDFYEVSNVMSEIFFLYLALLALFLSLFVNSRAIQSRTTLLEPWSSLSMRVSHLF